jgi:hypothetical protein
MGPLIPREFTIGDVYVPAIIVMFFIGAAVTWLLDRFLASTGIYRFVWHPSLFRAAMLVCICGLFGLSVYN